MKIILCDKGVCKPSTREKRKKLCADTYSRRRTPLGDITPNIISQQSKINNHIIQVCTQPSPTYNYFQSHRCTTVMHLAGVNTPGLSAPLSLCQSHMVEAFSQNSVTLTDLPMILPGVRVT